jgi:hypothetical protein
MCPANAVIRSSLIVETRMGQDDLGLVAHWLELNRDAGSARSRVVVDAMPPPGVDQTFTGDRSR